jgi:hypothetical protein
MKKMTFILVALIGFGLSANAQNFCDKEGNLIEFYPKKNSDGYASFFEGGVVQMAVTGNFFKGTYKVDKNATKTSDGSYYVIEFYADKDNKPSLYGRYFRGTSSRDGEIINPARIEILKATLEPCERKKR